ncbi:hypothetical protein OV760_29350, partial [Salmonella enterica subsp. enterica serovar 1,4,[5],12:i:-]|nr:hypothetical protein [Salmonella enterica subsp. enterica serovar 1,4,[5],12:i:-]
STSISTVHLAMANKTLMFLVALVAVVLAVGVMEAEADKLIGSCVWGATNYISNCAKYCKERGYKNGHCGSFANVNCWCET